LHALRWRHIDLDRGEVTIETRVDAHRQEDVTKTAVGMRNVPLGSALVEELRAWQSRSAYAGSDDLVFPNERGKYLSHDNMVKRLFLPLFDRLADLHAQSPREHPAAPALFNWHALRHFAISCWIDAGLAPKTIQTFCRPQHFIRDHGSLRAPIQIGQPSACDGRNCAAVCRRRTGKIANSRRHDQRAETARTLIY
jgi:integrase